MAPGTGAPGPAAADFSASAPASADMPAVRAGGIGGGDGRAERARAAVYGAIEEVGRAAIAAELRGGPAAAAAAVAAPAAGGPIDRAVRAAAARAGLPDPRTGAALPPGGGADAAAVLTSLLHYLLTAASVPSQRRTAVGGEEIDIVVPDAAAAPGAVAVCIAAEAGGGAAEARAAAAAAALRLPRSRVWVAGWRSRRRAGAARAGAEYLASDGSFSSLVPDLAAFAASPDAAAGGRRGRGRRLGLSGRPSAASASADAAPAA